MVPTNWWVELIPGLVSVHGVQDQVLASLVDRASI